MALPIPKLDDRSFKDLAEEVRSLIPRYSRVWTDFNPADPGITLLELFAWLSEMTLFRIDQIPPDHILRFLGLIGIEPKAGEPLQTTIARAVTYVSSQYRSVNAGDYETLTLAAMRRLHPDLQGRIVCVVDRNLELKNNTMEKPGHISLIVIPGRIVDGFCSIVGRPRLALLKYLKEELDSSRILTHRLHFVGPGFKTVHMSAELALESGADWKRVRAAAVRKLELFCDPVKGGPEGQGWPIGRYLYRSELYEILESIEGVDYTRSVTIEGSTSQKFVSTGKFEFVEIVPELNEWIE